ncbi:MAG: nitroreductase/quinone reductase family protein [Candidatus Nitrosopolaris sp.]
MKSLKRDLPILEQVMSKPINDVLDKSDEIELIVTGRISGKEIPRPVWFVNEDDLLYLLPVQGSNTNWYKNVQKNPHVKISTRGQQIITGKVKAITDTDKVKEVIEKFRSKYGVSDVKKYYTKFDVYVELLLNQPA